MDLINWLVNLRDETLIDKVRSLKESVPEMDWYDALSNGEKADIKKGLMDVADGRTIPHERFLDFFYKWQ